MCDWDVNVSGGVLRCACAYGLAGAGVRTRACIHKPVRTRKHHLVRPFARAFWACVQARTCKRVPSRASVDALMCMCVRACARACWRADGRAGECVSGHVCQRKTGLLTDGRYRPAYAISKLYVLSMHVAERICTRLGLSMREGLSMRMKRMSVCDLHTGVCMRSPVSVCVHRCLYASRRLGPYFSIKTSLSMCFEPPF
eukprot:2785029-Pleurochrysis_carterae.AAC.5